MVEDVSVVVQEEKTYTELYGFSDPTDKYAFVTEKGLNEGVVREISKQKDEPDWMLQKRLDAFKIFEKQKVPTWGADLSKIDFNDVYYYMKPTNKPKSDTWDQVPEDIKRTFDKLGIPEAERKFFAGAEIQYDSDVVYGHIREDLEKQGVIFTDTNNAVKKYPELVKKYFGTVIPSTDNKFAALNTAVWSGGSFIYVPKGVKVALPLQAYFRINAEKAGQFERTLIVADENADVTYIEGCFIKGTRVVTRSGTKPIEKVTVGDEVLTHNVTYNKVYHTQIRSHTGKLYKINYYGDTSTTLNVTDEHPFLAVKKEKEEYKNTNWYPKWIASKELAKGDYLAIPIDRTVESHDYREFTFKKFKGLWKDPQKRWQETTYQLNTDKDFFRLMGYYLAEGSIIEDHYVSFTFNKNETEYLADAERLIVKYFGKKPLIGKIYNNEITLTLCSTRAAKFFKEQFGKGAFNKFIPKWVTYESPNKQKELVKGLWRGDGSFMYKYYSWGAKRMFRINTISRIMARQIRDILLRLNIFASLNVAKRPGDRHDMYVVYVGGKYLQQFSSIVEFHSAEAVATGNSIMLINSIQKSQIVSYSEIIGNYAFVPIKSITSENVENLPVYNFSVEGDESYVANGVIVHNCTAPIYMSSSLHSAVVEIVAHKNAHVRYVTIQNWSKNVYNLVTQRAFAYENAYVEWIDANIGSKVNMKYPSVYLKERGAKGEILSIAIAGNKQIQDSGGKIYHLAPDTTSRIISKSVSKGSGVTTYRGLLHVSQNASNSKSIVRCDALLLDKEAKTNTYPYNEIRAEDATISHEATLGKIGDEQLFYLMSRGLNEEDALATIVLGFIEPLIKVLPMEYSVELKRLIKLDTTNSVG
jgi:Fe-S cluster assembly protein SufB